MRVKGEETDDRSSNFSPFSSERVLNHYIISLTVLIHIK